MSEKRPATSVCKHCGQPIRRDGDHWIHDLSKWCRRTVAEPDDLTVPRRALQDYMGLMPAANVPVRTSDDVQRWARARDVLHEALARSSS